MTLEQVKKTIRDIPDFPEKGIVFKDLTTIFKDENCLQFVSDELYNYYKDKGLTKIIGIDARGFIFGSILAYRLGIGFVPVRKKGKLPADSYEVSYKLEYGEATVEIHRDALDENDIVLIHDDLLATGGTLKAAIGLARLFHVKQIYTNTIVELDFLRGREQFVEEDNFYSLMHC